jgi:hypothetical protein
VPTTFWPLWVNRRCSRAVSPAGRQPAWEAATAWITALPVNRLAVLGAHRLTVRRTMRLLELRALAGIHLILVCRRPHLPAALHQALQTADYAITADFRAGRRRYYGTIAAVHPPADEPVRLADRWLTLPALERLVSYDSPAPCTVPCVPPLIAFRHRPPPTPPHRAGGPGSRPTPLHRDRPPSPGRCPRRRSLYRRFLPAVRHRPPRRLRRCRGHSGPARLRPLQRRLCLAPGAAVGTCLPEGRRVLRPARARPGPASAGRSSRPYPPAAHGGGGQAPPAAATLSISAPVLSAASRGTGANERKHSAATRC